MINNQISTLKDTIMNLNEDLLEAKEFETYYTVDLINILIDLSIRL